MKYLDIGYLLIISYQNILQLTKIQSILSFKIYLTNRLFSQFGKRKTMKIYSFLSSCDGYINPNPAAQRTVTLSDLRYVLKILGVGLFSASVTFFIEMMIYKVIHICRIKKTVKPLSDE